MLVRSPMSDGQIHILSRRHIDVAEFLWPRLSMLHSPRVVEQAPHLLRNKLRSGARCSRRYRRRRCGFIVFLGRRCSRGRPSSWRPGWWGRAHRGHRVRLEHGGRSRDPSHGRGGSRARRLLLKGSQPSSYHAANTERTGEGLRLVRFHAGSELADSLD